MIQTIGTGFFSICAYLAPMALAYAALSATALRRLMPAPMLVFLATGLGLGAVSFAMMLNLMLYGKTHFFLLLGIVWTLLISMVIKKKAFGEKSVSHICGPDRLLLAIVMALGLLFILLQLLKAPYGGGLDVWAIWKLKARFIFYGEWKRIFSADLSYSHPDYPLLYPLMMVWGWLGSGRENLASAWIIVFAFSLSIIGLLLSYFSGLGRAAALGASLLVLSTPQFAGVGSSQYADILIAYYVLAAALLYCEALKNKSAACAALCGIFLGLGCLVKNEGLAASLCLGIAALLTAGFKKDEAAQTGRLALCASAAVLPFLGVGLLLKYSSGAGSNELICLASANHAFGAQHFFERYLPIAAKVAAEMFEENKWVYGWAVLAAACWIKRSRAAQAENLFCMLLLGLMLLTYVMVYKLSPHDLSWHLKTSLDRCLTQIYPLAVFTAMRLLGFATTTVTGKN